MARTNMGTKESESQDLQARAAHTIGETHMVVPSVLTLFGLQMMMSFNPDFRKELTQVEIWCDLIKMVLLALTAGLIILPAAYHRQAEPNGLSQQFVELVSRVIPIALGSLALILGGDLYFMGLVVLKSRIAGGAAGLVTCGGLCVMWFIVPRLLQRRLRSRQSVEPASSDPRQVPQHGPEERTSDTQSVAPSSPQLDG